MIETQSARAFDVTPEQRAIGDLAREFALGEIAPHISQWDKEHRFPRSLYTKLNALGLMGIVVPEEYARAHGLEALGHIVDHADASWDPAYLALTPAMASRKVLERNNLKPSDIAIWEVNEAFAAVAWSTANLLGIDPRALNLLGGAVALGHPVGASGARIVGSVIRQLQRRGGGYGIAAICSGGGQGDAVLIRVE